MTPCDRNALSRQSTSSFCEGSEREARWIQCFSRAKQTDCFLSHRKASQPFAPRRPLAITISFPHTVEDAAMRCAAIRLALNVSAVPVTRDDSRTPRTATRDPRGCFRNRRARVSCRAGASSGAPLAADQDGPEPDGTDTGAAPSSSGKALQSVNVAGVSLFAGMAFTKSKALALPHIEVPDIAWVDWAALKRAGFKACVFDKDNTLTVPYASVIEPRVVASLNECLAVFGHENVAVLSNSAGLAQFDPTGAIADAMEKTLGISFLRHSSKKPAGSCTALTDRFKCASNEMVMIGDRYMTDVVYGNRHGMFTVRSAPFSDEGER